MLLQAPIVNPYANFDVSPGNFLSSIVRVAVTVGFIIGAVIFIFMFMSGAIGWIKSGGNKGEVEASKSKIQSAIVGMVLLLSLYIAIQIIESVFGISLTSIDLGALDLISS